MPLEIHTIVLLIHSALQPINSRLCDAQKSWRFRHKSVIEAASHNKEGRLRDEESPRRMFSDRAACRVFGHRCECDRSCRTRAMPAGCSTVMRPFGRYDLDESVALRRDPGGT